MAFEYEVVAVLPGGGVSPRDEVTTDREHAQDVFEEQAAIPTVRTTLIQLRRRQVGRWEVVRAQLRPRAIPELVGSD